MPCTFCGSHNPNKRKCCVCGDKICNDCIKNGDGVYRTSGLKCHSCVGKSSSMFASNSSSSSSSNSSSSSSYSSSKKEYYCRGCGQSYGSNNIEALCNSCYSFGLKQGGYN
jgi:hypothetical protein